MENKQNISNNQINFSNVAQQNENKTTLVLSDCNNQPTNKLKHWICNNWMYVVEILLLAIILTILCINYNNDENINAIILGIVLSFIGIIATFIVVSNYAQVKDIESKTKKDINVVVGELKKLKEAESNILKQINTINIRIGSIDKRIAILKTNSTITSHNERLEKDIKKVSQDTDEILKQFSKLWFPGREEIIAKHIKQIKK